MNLDRIDELEAASNLAGAQVDSSLNIVRAGFRPEPLTEEALDEVVKSLDEDAYYCESCGDEIGINRIRVILRDRLTCPHCITCASKAEQKSTMYASRFSWNTTSNIG